MLILSFKKIKNEWDCSLLDILRWVQIHSAIILILNDDKLLNMEFNEPEISLILNARQIYLSLKRKWQSIFNQFKFKLILSFNFDLSYDHF